MQNQIQIRDINDKDYLWINNFAKKDWGSTTIVTKNTIHEISELPGFVATQRDRPIGFIIYKIDNNECEIIALKSLIEKIGVGESLLNAVKNKVQLENFKRLYLITTNDNMEALKFYQERGFVIKNVYLNKLKEYREKIKPEIPFVGNNGIALRDEIELELCL